MPVIVVERYGRRRVFDGKRAKLTRSGGVVCRPAPGADMRRAGRSLAFPGRFNGITAPLR